MKWLTSQTEHAFQGSRVDADTPSQAPARRLRMSPGCRRVSGQSGLSRSWENAIRLALDLTANAAFEAGEETKTLLQSLDQDVEIYVLATEDAYSGSSYFLQAQRMMEHYPRLSPRVTLTYIDYVFDPTFAARYPDLSPVEGRRPGRRWRPRQAAPDLRPLQLRLHRERQPDHPVLPRGGSPDLGHPLRDQRRTGARRRAHGQRDGGHDGLHRPARQRTTTT